MEKPTFLSLLIRKHYWPMGLLLVILLVIGSIQLARPRLTPTLQVGTHSYALEVETTAVAQQKGLSGRSSLPVDKGMLFNFADPAVRCFWMKDMRFPIDMIWIGANKQVVHVESNVSPKTYPRTYCPSQPAQYVIEINAGQAKGADITIGRELNF